MRNSTAAYDLSQFAPEPKRESKVRVVRTQKKATQGKKAFKVKCLAYAMLLMLLMAGTVYSKTQLTEIKSTINDAKDELSSLESDYAYLSFKLESMVSLKYAEDYAVNELGLVKISANQTEYVNIHSENKIESNGEPTDFFQSLGGIFKTVMDFFGG
jgi:hypothetical protein